jgi:general secretion pathway protein G
MKRSVMKKRALTLLEMMIVILLIALITGVVGYNMKGSLDKGKIFKSRHAKEQLHELLLMVMAETGESRDQILSEWKGKVKALNIAKNSEELFKDGWGSEWIVSKSLQDPYDFEITSENAVRYQ